MAEEWQAEAERCRSKKAATELPGPDEDKADDRLLYNYDGRIKGLWPTLTSMRNVENTALLKLL